TVKYATADGTATSHGKNSDYAQVKGTLTFDPGVTSQTITVFVNGDTLVEPDETFFVNLSDPDGATIAGAQGTGIIKNDDGGIPTAVVAVGRAYPNVEMPTRAARQASTVSAPMRPPFRGPMERLRPDRAAGSAPAGPRAPSAPSIATPI